MTTPVLKVQMLGGFSLRLEMPQTRPVAVGPLPSWSATSLLANLVLSRAAPQARAELAHRFWPDAGADRARRRLSNALWQIRSTAKRAGGDDLELIWADLSTVQLSPELEVWVDAEQFESLLDGIECRYHDGWNHAVIDELTALVDGYKGDLLPGHEGETWADDRRVQVKHRYQSALAQLVRLTTSAGNYDAALRHARAQVTAEPLTEEWHRSVMRLCALNGQPTAAERQFEVCRTVLLDALGTAPALETVELIEQIRSDGTGQSQPPARPDASAAPLVGRADERSALLGRVNELVGGNGGVMLVEGDRGVGKSRLVTELIKGAEWRGVQVLRGRHAPGDLSTTSYGFLRDALAPAIGGLRGERLASLLDDTWLGQASSVIDGLPAPAHDEEEPEGRTEALARMILAQGQSKPTVLVLDDVHWCDEASIRVLLQAADRLADNRVLLCLAYEARQAQRSPAVWLAISELEAKPGASRHVIPALHACEVRELLGFELGAGQFVSETVVERLTEATGGNPQMILDLVRDGIDLSSPVWLELPAPGQLRPRTEIAGSRLLVDLLTRRLAEAPENVPLVLGAVAAMESPATAGLTSLATGLERCDALVALGDAVELGYLVESSEGCSFARELTRRAVYERLDQAERTGIHRRLSRAPEGAGGLALEELAHHALLGECVDGLPSETVLAVRQHQRDEAIKRGRAAELLHLIVGDDVTARSEAMAASVQFRQLGDGRHEAACLVTLASIDRRQRRRRLARRRLTAAREKAGASGDRVIEARALLVSALVEHDMGYDENVLEHVGAANVLMEDPWPSSESVLEPALLAVEALALARLGRQGEAVSRIEKSSATDRCGGGPLAHLVAWWRAEVLMTLGAHDAASHEVALARQRLSEQLDDLQPELLEGEVDPWTAVPEHRGICEAHQLYVPGAVKCRLPRLDAPTGRAFGPDDFVEVTWSVSEPGDWLVPAPVARRHRRVRRLVAQAIEQGGAVRVTDLAGVLEVSERTIKRDLAQLRAEGCDVATRCARFNAG